MQNSYNTLMAQSRHKNTRKHTSNRRLGREVRRLSQDLSSIHQTAQLLTGPMELQQVLEIVVKTIAQALDLDAAGLRLLDENTGTLALKATYGLSKKYQNKGPVTAGESELNLRTLHGEAIVVEDMRCDPHFKKYHNAVIREGLISSLSIGLTYKDKGIGILRLYSKRKRTFFPEAISLARTIASQSAAAIVNAHLYEEALEHERIARQLRLAGIIQRRLIPEQPPQLPGLDLAGIYVPCYDVGGDFYDFITFPDGRLLIGIGDIMGKGVPASLAMASLRSSLRAYAEQIEPLDELLRRVNNMFCNDSVTGEFATLFCAAIRADRATLTYCNAGHNRPILIRNGKSRELTKGDAILGISQDTPFHAHQIKLADDDMLVMFTDGLADAVNFKRQSFGRSRIAQAAKNSTDMSAGQVAKNILWLMRKFAGLTQRYDDTAIVVLKKTNTKNRRMGS